MSDTPKEYSFRNGCFLGQILIMVDGGKTGMGLKAAKQESWAFSGFDLRDISSFIACRDHEATRTVIYSRSEELATLNCPPHEFADQWIALKHSFDRIPVTEEGTRTVEVMGIHRTDKRP